MRAQECRRVDQPQPAGNASHVGFGIWFCRGRRSSPLLSHLPVISFLDSPLCFLSCQALLLHQSQLPPCKDARRRRLKRVQHHRMISGLQTCRACWLLQPAEDCCNAADVLCNEPECHRRIQCAISHAGSTAQDIMSISVQPCPSHE